MIVVEGTETLSDYEKYGGTRRMGVVSRVRQICPNRKGVGRWFCSALLNSRIPEERERARERE